MVLVDAKYNLGVKIRYARKENHLTQKQLADKLGIAAGTIQAYELGKRNVPLEQLLRIAEVLDVPPTFLSGEGQSLNEGQQMSLFTEYTDTMDYITGLLSAIYGSKKESFHSTNVTISYTVYGNGNNAFILEDDELYMLKETIINTMKTMVDWLLVVHERTPLEQRIEEYAYVFRKRSSPSAFNEVLQDLTSLREERNTDRLIEVSHMRQASVEADMQRAIAIKKAATVPDPDDPEE